MTDFSHSGTSEKSVISLPPAHPVRVFVAGNRHIQFHRFSDSPGVLGYHLLIATRVGTGEVLMARMRRSSANTVRGIVRFVDELAANLTRAGAAGPRMVRADSGFWSWKMIDRLNAHGIGWSITVRMISNVKAAIEEIPESSWRDIDYSLAGEAQVAETTYISGRGKNQRRVRLVVRRTRLVDEAQRRLWPDWRHHGFITSDEMIDVVEADRFYREHAVVELVIRDLKEGVGLEHIPSGHYHANAAWLGCAVLARNLGVWCTILGCEVSVTNRTRRTRLISLAAVIVNRSGRMVLWFPARWPWANEFHAVLSALRFLPTLTGLHPVLGFDALRQVARR